MPSALSTPESYQDFIYTLRERHTSIVRSTLVYIPSGALFGRVEGWLLFNQEIVLCVHEYLNFELELIEGYGYEVSQSHVFTQGSRLFHSKTYCRASYPHKDKLYWYDSFPHPNNPALASTDPHHKHIPPDIKHHRIPAPQLSFARPNLPILIAEIELLLQK